MVKCEANEPKIYAMISLWIHVKVNKCYKSWPINATETNSLPYWLYNMTVDNFTSRNKLLFFNFEIEKKQISSPVYHYNYATNCSALLSVGSWAEMKRKKMQID